MDLNDWRLTGQDKYMKGAHLNTVKPEIYAEGLEEPQMWHEHCEFCMDTIDINYKDVCYCTDNNYRFVCNECFQDFRDDFDWKLD